MKLFLIIDNGSLGGRRFELHTGFLTIGRGERCNVRFDPLAERIASKEHCYIEGRADGFFLTDNASTNGTLVNGLRIQSVRLKSGDRLQFGRQGTTATVFIESVAEETSVLPGASAETAVRLPEIKQSKIATEFYLPDSVPNSQVTHVAPRVEARPPAAPPAAPDFYLPQPARPFQNPRANLRNSLQSLGMGSLPPNYLSAAEPAQRNYFLIAAVIMVIIFLSLVVMLLIMTSLSSSPEKGLQLTPEGVITAIVASFVAFIPAFFYLLPLVWLDRYDPEPAWLLALTFAWGALVAVIVSLVVNTLLGAIFGDAFSAVVSAPVFEEGSKGLGVLVLLVFFRKYFDDILDGIIFSGVIALGFATVENVLYYGNGIVQGGSDGLFATFIVRGILSPFAHVTFTAMIGIGCGIARESHNLAVRLLMPLLGYICAVLLHVIWNGMAVFGGGIGFLLGYLFLEFPFFCLFIGFSFYVMYRQNKILREMLAIDVARGLIPAHHMERATSAFSSTAWLLGGLFSGKFKARSAYLRAIGKLGLSYWHIQRATAAQGQTASFQQNPVLRAEVLRWQPRVD